MLYKIIKASKEAPIGREEYNNSKILLEDGCEITIRKPRERETDFQEASFLLEIQAEIKASSKMNEGFEKLYEYESNSEFKQNIIDDFNTRIEQRLIGGYTLPEDILPSNFVEYMVDTSRNMSSKLSNVYRTLRWINNSSNSAHPFYKSQSYWSLDGIEWMRDTLGYSMTLGGGTGLNLHPRTLQQVKLQIDKSEIEPFHHELLVEAKNLRRGFPRSSLVISVTAAEAGIKHCISRLKPDNKWLIENIPSPPIVLLMQEYLPTLAAQNSIDGKIAFPKESILKPLKKGISMRNRIVHGGMCNLRDSHLAQLHQAVSDLLYLIDYYCGHNWSIKHISRHSRTELNLKT